MIVLKMNIDNFCMFKDFSIDFTIDRLQGESIVGSERLEKAPKIKYKKLNIIMGGNATGKTTFGKVLCEVENLLVGRPCTLFNKIYNFELPSSIDILFAEDKYLFNYIIEINNGIFREKLRYTKLRKSQNLKKHLEHLDSEDFIQTDREILSVDRDKILVSSVIDNEFKPENKKFNNFFIEKFAYYFRFASFTENSMPANVTKELLKETEKILKIIDNSIESVRMVESKSLNNVEDDIKEDDYYIVFKNKDRVLVEDANPKNIRDNRLSEGTIEAIEMSYILNNLNAFPGTVYLDEQMAYMHTELSNALILKIIESNKNSQIFITSHNENVLDLNVPIHSFTFFNRKNDKIEVINPEQTLNKNDRDLKLYVQNNYFESYPELDALWDGEDE